MESDRRYEKAAQQETECVELLYRRYSVLLRRVADQILHDPPLAEDVVQDVFCRMLRKNGPETLQPSGRKSWLPLLVCATRNTAIDYYRKRKRAAEVSYDICALVLQDVCGPAQYLHEQSGVHLADLILTLPMNEKQKLLLILKYCCGLPDKAIASSLGLSHGAVRTRLVRARRQIKHFMQHTP